MEEDDTPALRLSSTELDNELACRLAPWETWNPWTYSLTDRSKFRGDWLVDPLPAAAVSCSLTYQRSVEQESKNVRNQPPAPPTGDS